MDINEEKKAIALKGFLLADEDGDKSGRVMAALLNPSLKSSA